MLAPSKVQMLMEEEGFSFVEKELVHIREKWCELRTVIFVDFGFLRALLFESEDV